MCSNPDTYEFRLSLDLPQQSAVPTDTFSALRKSMNIQRRTARVSIRLLRCLILWEYDRSRHANIAHGGIWFCRC